MRGSAAYSIIGLVVVGLVFRSGVARAGAFMMPEGQGQIIGGVGYIEASRTFDRSGKPMPTAPFRKTSVGAFAEYGLTSWFTIVVAPSLARMQAGTPVLTNIGSDESGLGGRVRLYDGGTQVVSFQVLAEPGIGARRDPKTETAFGGPHGGAVDMRLQFGQAFSVFGYAGFVDLEPGARIRGAGWPSEGRFDMAIGLRVSPGSQILIQTFASIAPRAGALVPHEAYAKLQVSLVHDLSSAWSIQVGVLRTMEGRNAAREVGPIAALWYHF